MAAWPPPGQHRDPSLRAVPLLNTLVLRAGDGASQTTADDFCSVKETSAGMSTVTSGCPCAGVGAALTTPTAARALAARQRL